MTLKNIQNDVEQWTSNYKIQYWKPHEIIARLAEETGELAREVNHIYGPKKKKSTEDLNDLSLEIGDVIFTLTCLANSHKIDLDETWKKVMDKCYGRDKDRFEKK
jgi:NTP pyrophosphatase (non-canonical NTP hydrolase)